MECFSASIYIFTHIHPRHQICLVKPILLGEEEVASKAQKQMEIEILNRAIQEMHLEMEE